MIWGCGLEEEREVPSGRRGCGFGFFDGALGHGEVGIVAAGWALVVCYCVVGDGLEFFALDVRSLWQSWNYLR